MYFLTYVSSAVVPFTGSELCELLSLCEKNNTRDEITGMLLYKDGNFMQVLEGTEERVRLTHAKIASDPRHGGLITLMQGIQKERQFPGWSMGFRDLCSSLPKPAAYSEFLNTPLTNHEFSANPGRAQKLLMVFKQSM